MAMPITAANSKATSQLWNFLPTGDGNYRFITRQRIEARCAVEGARRRGHAPWRGRGHRPIEAHRVLVGAWIGQQLNHGGERIRLLVARHGYHTDGDTQAGRQRKRCTHGGPEESQVGAHAAHLRAHRLLAFGLDSREHF